MLYMEESGSPGVTCRDSPGRLRRASLQAAEVAEKVVEEAKKESPREEKEKKSAFAAKKEETEEVRGKVESWRAALGASAA